MPDFNWSQLERADTPAGAPPATEPASGQPSSSGFDWSKLESAPGAPAGGASAAGTPQSDIWSELSKTAEAEKPASVANPVPSTDIWNKMEPIDDPRNVTDRYAQTADTRGLSADERAYGNSDPEKMEDEPWYSKAWEWMNSPLYDLHKWGTREGAGQFERGVESGLEDIGSGFLTPLQLGLTLATFGGGAVEGAGLSVLRSIGVNEVAAPIVARAAKGLMTAGFSIDMLHGLMTQSPEFLDALKDGDIETATRLGTNMLATGVMLREGLKHGIEDGKAVKEYINKKNGTVTDHLKLSAELAGKYDEAKSMGNDSARTKMEAIATQLKEAGVDNKTTEAGIRHYMTQDGEVSRIQKMIGIAEGTIRPREYTAEESAQIEKGAELRKWASESGPVVLNSDGSPRTLYLTDSAEGTHQLGQTLSYAGDPADAHYVQMKKPYTFDSEEAMKAFVKRVGDSAGLTDPKEAQVAAVHELESKGNDGIVYKGDDGTAKVITFHDEQYRPVEEFKKAADAAWNREHVYAAVDSQFADQIRNAGLKSPRRKEMRYYATADEALKNAVLPESGNAKDVKVYSVPRAEVEQGIREDLTQKAGPTEAGPRELVKDTVPDSDLVTSRTHMPGHELEINEEGKLTGRSTPLRPVGAEDMPGDNSRFVNSYTPEEKQELINGMKAALSLTDNQKAVAKTLRQLYDQSFQKAWEHGLIRQWVESYHPQAWASEDSSMWNTLFGKNTEKVTSGTMNELRNDTNAGHFDTNVNQAKHRAFQTEFQGIMAGEKFKSDDLSMHAFNHVRAIESAIAGREFVDGLRARSLKATDGRPAAVLAGTTRVMGGDTGNPAIAISPRSIKAIHISPEKIQAMREGINPRTNMTDLEEGLQNGTIERLPWTIDVEGPDGPRKENAYAYSTEGYVSIDHPSMRGWGYSGHDTAGAPAIMHGNIMVHPDFATEVRRVVGAEKSVVRESKILSGINVAAGEAKGLLLSISPFHIVQEGLRAAMVGINPLRFDHIDINSNPDLQIGVKNGLVRKDYRAKDKFSTGYASHSKLISAIPGLNRMQGAMQDFLFDKYIPGLKDRAYLKMYEEMRAQHPQLSADEASSRTADMTNDIFGGQNWRKLGVSTSQQDFARMAALAPDWLLSEVRMLGRAAGLMDKESGAMSRKMMAKQVAGLWIAARVLNMLSTGQMHNEAPFGVASKNDKGEEKVYSIRTLPTDLMHVISDPSQFIANRVNPLTVRPSVEFLTGRDAMGRKATWDTQASDLVRNVVPIAGQNLIRGGEMSGIDQITKAAGATIYKYRTRAEKLAQEYASDRMPSGPVNPENLAKHQEDIRLEDALRKGTIARGDLLQKVSKRRADEIIRRAPMSPLQARFDRLPLSESVNVWDSSTPSEKDQLKTLLWKKRQEFIKQHSVRERESDPTWRKLQSIYADIRR